MSPIQTPNTRIKTKMERNVFLDEHDEEFMNHKPRVPKLNINNYHAWRISVQSILISIGLWDFAKNEQIQLPKDASYADKIKERQMAMRASGCILTYLNQADADEMVEHTTSPHIIWESLKNTYSKSNFSRKVEVKRKLVNFKWKSNNLSTEVTRYKIIYNTYKSIGLTLDESDMIIQFLQAPSKQYLMISDLLIAEMTKETTLDDVVSKLKTISHGENYGREINHKESSNRDKRNSNVKRDTSESALNCTFCDRTNHNTIDCYSRKGKKEHLK